MRILVISDTHGSLSLTEKALKSAENFDEIWHLGDVLYHGPRNPLPEGYSPKELTSFLKKHRVKYIRGNCDADVDIRVLEIPEMPRIGMEFLGDVKILLVHGDQFEYEGGDPVSLAQAHGCSVVLFGHTHVPLAERCEGVLLLNPGSVSLPKSEAGPTFGIIDMDEKKFYLCSLEGDVLKEVMLVERE
ncbi:phosphodiesterase [Thermotoga sp. 38H-to]|uniref:phosphodiesterase n=1 Tax=Thermotoga sp. 38H-to TaxID=1755812 RepID=UPI0013EDC36D|nr:phosphodiesterase [Thermotoga sp. 38H-to]KAF2960113.1 phosphodiesterase [Thermotoga sp. 38H-to]